MTTPRISVCLPVLAPTPFLQAMTEFAIRTLRAHADNDFELVVVEAEYSYFDPEERHTTYLRSQGSCMGEWLRDPLLHIDKYLRFNPKIGGVKELNAGVDVATGGFVVSTGNDVIVPPHWDTYLLEPFEKYPDCGISSLSAMEPGVVVGSDIPLPVIIEGMYSPFMMFRSARYTLDGSIIPARVVDPCCSWPTCECSGNAQDCCPKRFTYPTSFDESYVKIYQDSDFIMKMYQAGFRAYRSCRAAVHHLCRMTSDRVEPEQHKKDLAHDEELFYSRWGDSPLMMFGLIRYGQWVYGREHLSLLNPINRHR